MSTSQEMGKISVYQRTMGVIFGDANFVKNQAKSSELFSLMVSRKKISFTEVYSNVLTNHSIM